MMSWKTLSRKTLLQLGRFLTIEQHAVELPNGRVISDWSWIITPDFAVILAETKEGQFLCFRQTKYAVEGVSLAPPGGFIEPGEEPLAAAKRELLEETGYSAEQWRHLGTFAVDANRGAGKAHLFLARGTVKAAAVTPDDLEEQELLLLSRAELERAVDEGQFKCLPWAAVVAMGLRHITDEKPS